MIRYTLAWALLLAFGLVMVSLVASASAADSETAKLGGYMNTYRAEVGAPPLSASAQLNSEAQAVAQEVVDDCSYAAMYNTGHTTFGSYGYPNADMLWNAWLKDPIYLKYIGDAKYKTVGIGRAFTTTSCNLGTMWIVMLSTSGGGVPIPPPPPATTVPAPPTPTPTATPVPTPATPAPTPTPTPAVTSAAPTPTGTQTVVNLKRGDINCDGAVNPIDALVLLRYDAALPVVLAPGCPPIAGK